MRTATLALLLTLTAGSGLERDAGCGIDPNGCPGGLTASADSGPIMDPNGGRRGTLDYTGCIDPNGGRCRES